jgi:hypothetical protein
MRTAVRPRAARVLRATTGALCAAGIDPLGKHGARPLPADRQQARCACLESGFTRLNEQQAVDALAAWYASRGAAASSPAPAPGPLQEIDQACRAEDTTR